MSGQFLSTFKKDFICLYFYEMPHPDKLRQDST